MVALLVTPTVTLTRATSPKGEASTVRVGFNQMFFEFSSSRDKIYAGGSVPPPWGRWHALA